MICLRRLDSIDESAGVLLKSNNAITDRWYQPAGNRPVLTDFKEFTSDIETSLPNSPPLTDMCFIHPFVRSYLKKYDSFVHHLLNESLTSGGQIIHEYCLIFNNKNRPTYRCAYIRMLMKKKRENTWIIRDLNVHSRAITYVRMYNLSKSH